MNKSFSLISATESHHHPHKRAHANRSVQLYNDDGLNCFIFFLLCFFSLIFFYILSFGLLFISSQALWFSYKSSFVWRFRNAYVYKFLRVFGQPISIKLFISAKLLNCYCHVAAAAADVDGVDGVDDDGAVDGARTASS